MTHVNSFVVRFVGEVGGRRALGGQVADTRVVELELPLQALDAGAGLVAGHSGAVSMGGTVAR